MLDLASMNSLPAPELRAAASAVRKTIATSCQGLVERESLVELMVLCAVAREHLLVVGPPGTAKSEAVRRVARRLGGRYFEYLLGRFTEPSELFGPIRIDRLKDGVVETDTSGMLPEADVVFLDEVFLGSTAILNTLLGILNERTFRRGHSQLQCPLRVCVGATNQLPEEPQLAAFADRFLAYAFVAPIGDSGLEALLRAGTFAAAEASSVNRLSPKAFGAPLDETTVVAANSLEPHSSHAADAPPRASMSQLDSLTRCAAQLDLAPVQPAIAEAIRRLRRAGVQLSDRRIVRSQRLVAAATVLSGRVVPSDADLWPLVVALPSESSQHLGREVLKELLASSANPTLTTAALETSQGPQARAEKLLKEANDLFLARPTPRAPASQSLPSESRDSQAPASDEDFSRWLLRLESVIREIDATFGPDNLPQKLAPLRQEIADILQQQS